MAKIKKTKAAHRVDGDLAIALEKAEPFARHILSDCGVHPAGGDGTGPLNAAQDLAGIDLTHEDEDARGNIVAVIEHAYIVGVAVGLKLRGAR